MTIAKLWLDKSGEGFRATVYDSRGEPISSVWHHSPHTASTQAEQAARFNVDAGDYLRCGCCGFGLDDVDLYIDGALWCATCHPRANA